MSKKRFTHIRKVPEQQSTVVFESLPEHTVVPYDENLLERSWTQWQFGDWQSLVHLNRETLQHHPDRAKLALLAAAAQLQIGDSEKARYLVQLAKSWGCSRRLISQIIISGVHNSLGRALSLNADHAGASQHFEKAVEIGMPGNDSKLLRQSRRLQQLKDFAKYTEATWKESSKEKLGDIHLNHTGYVSDKWDSYLKAYDSIFSNHKNCGVRLLEIGVQNGGSLEIWERFFNNAKKIVGCDINKNCGDLKYASKKIKIVVGDINSKEALDQIIECSSIYDIIIDDGSHKSSDIVATFCKLFPLLSRGGIYVVEDLHCSYWKGWEGGLDEQKSSISFFKSLIDLLNQEHWELHQPIHIRLNELGFPFLNEEVLLQIHSIKFYNSMCVVEKKEKSENILGVRRVVGDVELICDVKKYNGTCSSGMDK